MLAQKPFAHYTISLICNNLLYVCNVVVELLATDKVGLEDEEAFKVFLGHYPSGTSMNVLFHFLQDIRDDQISTEFDYYKKVGDAKHSPNQIKETINLHPIRDLGVPISMFVGTRDILATT